MKLCILSADDDEQVLDVHRDIMAHYGFDTQCTTKLSDMKGDINVEDIDCIHIDINFNPKAAVPDYDRPNGLRELRDFLNRRKDIPVMVISGYIDEEAKRKAREYRISDAIYKWYQKPADYDVIALDTIKALNDIKFKNRGIPTNSTPGILPIIKLKPQRLLNKLEDISYKILGKLETGAEDFDKELNLFKDLVNTHLGDYFALVTGNHLIIANYFIAALSKADPKTVSTKRVIEFILGILREFEESMINDAKVRELKQSLEQTFKITIESIDAKQDLIKQRPRRRLKQVKLEALEDRHATLINQYKAHHGQLKTTLSDAEKISIQEKIEMLEEEIKSVETKINQLQLKVT